MRITPIILAILSISLIAAKPAREAAKEPAKESITDVKALEARVDAAKAELDKARAAALPDWQTKPQYVQAKADLDAKKAALDVARKTGSESDQAKAGEAYTQAKLNYDKVVSDLEGANDTIVTARKNWEEAVKDLGDFKRQLSDTSKPLEGVRAIVSALPREYWPTESRGWTKLQEKAANKWLADNLLAKRLRINGTANTVDQQRGGRGAVIHFQRMEASMGDRTLNASVSALFPESQVAAVRKINSGTPVAVEGSIRVLHMKWDKDSIDVEVSVGYSTLVSK